MRRLRSNLMSLMNGHSNRSYLNMIFAFTDGLLIMSGIVIGNFIRFGGKGREIIYNDYLVVKIITIVTVIQVVFYYFDLYEFKSLRNKTKMAILLLEALGIASIILAVFYYFFPDLSIWRGMLVLSLTGIFILTFAWRILYPWLVSNRIFKERILIIGTGQLAAKIENEINENGQGTFEIVGFVDEDRERIGEKIQSDDYRGLQPDLFHLQRR
jgi:FlaA1/EpsC-like NDP-sugar epimerase